MLTRQLPTFKASMNIFNYFAITILMFFYQYANAQTLLSPGDVAVIGYNFKDPDQFSFIFLRDVDAGTVLNITDCGYDAPTAGFRAGEGVVTYTVPAGGFNAGTIVTYPDDAGFVTHGVSGFFGLSVDGDQLLFYQGSFTSPAFIYGLNVTGNDDNKGWQQGAVDNNTSALPPGLVDGNTALAQTKIVNSRLNCTGIAVDKSLFLTQIVDEYKWDRSNTVRFSLPDITCDYTILKFEKMPELHDIAEGEKTIIDAGYTQIDVYSSLGQLILSVYNLQDALIGINREKMYIFMVYYPDRLEVHKILIE